MGDRGRKEQEFKMKRKRDRGSRDGSVVTALAAQALDNLSSDLQDLNKKLGLATHTQFCWGSETGLLGFTGCQPSSGSVINLLLQGMRQRG